jgi:hypothetical protein
MLASILARSQALTDRWGASRFRLAPDGTAVSTARVDDELVARDNGRFEGAARWARRERKPLEATFLWALAGIGWLARGHGMTSEARLYHTPSELDGASGGANRQPRASRSKRSD